jgi:hypothetical protein
MDACASQLNKASYFKSTELTILKPQKNMTRKGSITKMVKTIENFPTKSTPVRLMQVIAENIEHRVCEFLTNTSSKLDDIEYPVCKIVRG